MTMIKPLMGILVAVSLSACAETETEALSSEPYAAWDEAARKLYMELAAVGSIPTSAEVGIPPYSGAKLISPALSAGEGNSICQLTLGVNDSPSKVRDFYVKKVGDSFRLMDLGYIYIFNHKEDDDISIHFLSEGAGEYTTEILMNFRPRNGYRCVDLDPAYS